MRNRALPEFPGSLGVRRGNFMVPVVVASLFALMVLPLASAARQADRLRDLRSDLRGYFMERMNADRMRWQREVRPRRGRRGYPSHPPVRGELRISQNTAATQSKQSRIPTERRRHFAPRLLACSIVLHMVSSI